MATIAPPPTTSHQANPRPKATPSGTDQLIDERIEEARRSLWWAELIRSGLKLVITTIIAILVWLVVDQWVYSPNVAVRSVVFVGLLGLAGWYLKVRVLPLFGSTVRPEYAARALERNLPELRQSLTSYVTLRSESNKTALQTRVVRSMGSVTAGRLRTYDEIPEEAAGNFRWWIATALVFALLLGYAVASPKNALHSVARLVAPIAEIDPARRVKITEVLPGNVEAMAGRKLQISAFVTGIREEEQITCRWDLPSGRQELALIFDPDSNRFAGELWLPHSASGAVSYTIQAGDASEGPYYLQVQDLPVVALQSVHYTPPKYTGQTSHTSSSGSIMGLAGTQVQILATTNRSVSIAQIEFSPRLLGDRIRATAGVRDLAISEDGTSLSFTFTLQTATGPSAAVEQDSYRISVQDASGQGNSEPIIYPIRVVSDLPPEVSITMPFRSPKEMPIDAQQVIEVHASDPDYGLRHVRLEMRSGLDLMAEPILWSHPTGQKGNHVSEYRFRPAEHDLGIGSIVQIVAIATDNRESDEDANLESNVTRSDPIELKITAASTLPPPDDPNAGGLSAPDDRPASDHQKQPEEGADDSKGDQQEGGGGSGGSDASDSQGGNQQGGEGTSQEGGQNDKPSGDQQGGEGTSQEGGQNDKPSGDQQGGEGTSQEGGQNDKPSGDQQGGEGTSQEGGQNDKPSDDQQGGEGTSQEGGQNDKPSGDQQGGEGTSQEGGQSDKPSGNQQGGEATSQEGGQNDKPSGDQQGGEGGAGTQPENQTTEDGQDDNPGGSGNPNGNNNESGGTGNASDSEGNPGNNQNDSQNPEQSNTEGGSEGQEGKNESDPENEDGNTSSQGGQQGGDTDASMNNKPDAGNNDSAGNGNATGNEGQQGGENSGNQDEPSPSNSGSEGNQSDSNQQHANRSPEHDGEAFERIRDYLEEKRNERQGSGTHSRPSESGSQESGSQESGSQESGSQEPGSQESGSQESGSQEPGSQESGSQESGSQEPGSQESGSQESGSQEPGSQESGSQESGSQEPGSQEPGSQESGSQESGSQEPGSQESGSQESGSQEPGSQESGSQEPGSQESGSQESGSQEPGSQESGSQEPGSQESGSQEPVSQQTQPPSGVGASPSGSGTGGDGTGESAESPIPPDPVNIDYAKKATDMVLDYLDETRDAPDQNLLDKLNWSEEDLARFSNRWQQVREINSSPTDPENNQAVKEALESLGLRSPNGKAKDIREAGDSLRGIRDSGNRKPPPAAYRDAFDAFRRAMGRSQ